MDHQSVYSTHVYDYNNEAGDDSRVKTQKDLEDFVLKFRLDNNFVYRDQLKENALLKKYYCDVDIGDLIKYNEELAHRLVTEPAEIIPLFESALKRCTHRIVFPHQQKVSLPEHQLLLHSSAEEVAIRNLDSFTISRLVRVPGIVIGASVMSSKATKLNVRCRNCGFNLPLSVTGGFTGVTLPRQCGRVRQKDDVSPKCPLDPYVVMHEDSEFVDQQVIKLQEAPDQVPVGELPRHVLISADRYLTNRVVPGSRCTITGIFSIYQNKSSTKGGSGNTGGAIAIRTPYLRAVGIQTDIDQTAKGSAIYTEEEEQEFLELSRRPDLYNIMTDCIAPSIYGNRDIKKAILCLLMGGSKKILPDGMKLRGDINVLLLGDPGTAKSQLLKFVEKVAPIAIYTSGKGSSAAGLTASVQREQSTREFYLEGGAMVLADGGVVCIDEFDKMRDEDRVAIHEAMEQQTISIAKAGITTILNARTSVLAAANPIFGRYDDMKSPGENIDFQTTILSRFDMIFIVKDEHERGKDERMAKHVMGIHMGGRGVEDQAESEIPVEKLRRYISYCKSRCAPRLSAEAAEKLSSHFVSIRRQVHQTEQEMNARSSIPITVRQLEAIVRITESLAKLTLSPIATEQHVDEAIRLFLCSTMDAVNQGNQTAMGASKNGGGSGISTGVGAGGAAARELFDEAARVEVELKRRLPIGWSTSLATLRREMVEVRGFSEQALNRALQLLQRRDTIMFRNQGAQVYRNGA
ncbi:minichromosome maintenance protein 5 [Sporothrix eucalyptigena]